MFSEQNLDDPYETFRALRDKAPALWLKRIDCWAIPRYAGVREVLYDWKRFSAAQGVGLNSEVNTMSVDTVLASDPPLHDALRGVLTESLSPRAIRSLTDHIRVQAEELVTALVAKGSFDAVTDLAQVFPPSIVADLLGIPLDVRPRLLPWGDAMFNSLGPANHRMRSSLPALGEMFQWAHTVQPAELAEGSMGRAVYEAADAGKIDRAHAPQLLAAYTAAAMDTTVNSIGSAVWLFSRHPQQWDAVRNDHALIPAAFNEVLRFESPVQYFTRVAPAATQVDGVQIAAGDRVLIMYGSANRDERHFGDTAATFDIGRDARDHVAFGYGLHACAGQAFARMEAHALLAALAGRVERFTVDGPVSRHLNNTVRGLASLPVTVTRT
ncbi:cytochrome P450 [Mycobacterium sp. 4858]|uniref:cytochrome P450 n=1 Tax=Mycobacterium sp. 4858 TaxID=2057185 RepID=UPI001304DEB3|nr:cytochrome P450 [Mycobacterium sp. 4858]